MSNKLMLAKLVAQTVAGLSVSKVVYDIIQNNANVETTADALKVMTGSLVIGSMAVKASSDYIEGQTVALQEWWNDRKAEPTPAK